MDSREIRQKFLDYFKARGHEIIESSSLVPKDDPTLLFTNAGMVQFKRSFLGQEKRGYTRATTSQKCVRAGGKHNDLENVGYTLRHHTFFEMLGNFSFGDYFKEEAVTWAWELLTEGYGLPKDRLYASVYTEDDEAYRIWEEKIGIPTERIVRLGEKDNFWAMGDTGPCGPCSEILIDQGPSLGCGRPDCGPGCDCDRYLEIWNLVFTQFDRGPDGKLTPLPKPNIDTGMGLERIAAVMQGVHSNYEIDIFTNLIAAVAAITRTGDLTNQSLRVIADHIRSCAFLIVDEVLPSNEGRGYVLRRIIRRALRHGHKLGVDEPFFYKLVKYLVTEMGEAYPELIEKQTIIEQALRREEEKFAETLDRGMHVLEQALDNLDSSTIPGTLIFQLYDTYGFPVDLTNDIARERGYALDMEDYERCMNEQRQRARAAGQFDIAYTAALNIEGQTEFTGYTDLENSARVVALYRDMVPVDRLNVGDDGFIVLDKTLTF